MSTNARLLVLISLLLLTACSSDGEIRIPGLYRIDIQQGNVIDQTMIDKLRPGMDKNQVHFILGTPAVVDPFHTDQWEYIYTMAESGDNREQRHVRIHFKDEKIAYIDGDVISTGRIPGDALRQSRTVEVPLKDESTDGFLSRLYRSLPFTGDDKPAAAKPAEPEEKKE